MCLHSLRLLQSVLLEEEVLLLLGSSLLDPDLQAHVSRFCSSTQPRLRLAAQQTLEDLQALQQVPQPHLQTALSEFSVTVFIFYSSHEQTLQSLQPQVAADELQFMTHTFLAVEAAVCVKPESPREGEPCLNGFLTNTFRSVSYQTGKSH